MFKGLALMNREELAEITRLIGVDVPPSSQEVLFDIVTGWLARGVNLEGCSQVEVERCVLEWTARAFQITYPPSMDTNELERLIRLRIASDAVDFLSPGWTISCALAAVGRSDTMPQKLDLLERAAGLAVPSQAALREIRSDWETNARKWAKTNPREELADAVEALENDLEAASECLSLGLALSLLDGSIPFNTERLFKELSDDLGLSRGDSDAIQKKVSDLFWTHHNAASPTGHKDKIEHDPVVRAARQTVFEAGALEALATEAKMKLFESIEGDPPKKSGLSRLMGSLSGISPFFSKKMKNATDATMARVVYHTILKQHAAVAAQKAQEVVAKAVEEMAPPVVAAEPAPQASAPAVAESQPQPEQPQAAVEERPDKDFLTSNRSVLDEAVEKVDTGSAARKIKLDL